MVPMVDKNSLFTSPPVLVPQHSFFSQFWGVWPRLVSGEDRLNLALTEGAGSGLIGSVFNHLRGLKCGRLLRGVLMASLLLLGITVAGAQGEDSAEVRPVGVLGQEESEAVVEFLNAADVHAQFLDSYEGAAEFPSAAACATCHPDHYREWSVSAHAYSQLSPVFNTMHAAILEKTSGTNGDFCIRCHTPIGMAQNEPLFTSNLKRGTVSVEGITCVVCHRIDKNYGKVNGRRGLVKGSLYDPISGPTGDRVLKSVLATNSTLRTSNEGDGEMPIHGGVNQFDPITTSAFCASCHDVNLPNGFRLEEAFSQYKNSPAAAAGTSCQDCHMGKVPGTVTGEGDANYHHGPAARIGGALWAKPGDVDYGKPTPVRKKTNHMFVGPDYSIVHPGIFPHSKDLRDHIWMWRRERLEGDVLVVEERAGLKHILEFRWEAGWGDPMSSFEKRMDADPGCEASLPWPWDDREYRMEFRHLLNEQFRLLNEADRQRHQIMRRGFQLGDFTVTRDDERGLDFEVEVHNGTDGHGVPTGFDAERLIFLEVTVRDAVGRTIFQSGDRDPNGDVRDLHSIFVHHHAEKSGETLSESAWKEAAGMELLKGDRFWEPDKDLFSLQSRFLTRNFRGGEREQVLSVNYSADPLPYVRPEARPSGIYARPAGQRKQGLVIPPNGSRTAEYRVPAAALSGARPYEVEVRFIAQMVPVNLIKEIGYVGFDYDLSMREVAKRVVYGHRVSTSTSDQSRRGGAMTLWDRKVVIDGERELWDLRPSEKDIMAPVAMVFPYDPMHGVRHGERGFGVVTDRVFKEAPLPARERVGARTVTSDPAKPAMGPLEGLKKLLPPIENVVSATGERLKVPGKVSQGAGSPKKEGGKSNAPE